MKKLNKNIPLSDKEVLNKYILTYTKPHHYIEELKTLFLEAIIKTQNKELIDYIFTQYYDPNYIIHHTHSRVVELTISQGYFIDEFLKENNLWTKYLLVHYGYKHDVLHKDDDVLIRRRIAMAGNYLKELSSDTSPAVRYEIAVKGHFPEKYYKDK